MLVQYWWTYSPVWDDEKTVFIFTRIIRCANWIPCYPWRHTRFQYLAYIKESWSKIKTVPFRIIKMASMQNFMELGPVVCSGLYENWLHILYYKSSGSQCATETLGRKEESDRIPICGCTIFHHPPRVCPKGNVVIWLTFDFFTPRRIKNARSYIIGSFSYKQ